MMKLKFEKFSLWSTKWILKLTKKNAATRLVNDISLNDMVKGIFLHLCMQHKMLSQSHERKRNLIKKYSNEQNVALRFYVTII